MPGLSVRRLGYALGAEVTGVDASKPLDAAAVAEIRRAWLEHMVLCFPRQNLRPDELVAFAENFGELDDGRATPHLRHPDEERVTLILSKTIEVGEKKIGYVHAEAWHSDLSHTVRPTTATLLNARQLPDVGGETLFANMYAAYETLSPRLREMLDRLEAVHDIRLGVGYHRGGAELAAERSRINPPVVHPLVGIHPETGRKLLYLSERISHFAGMTPEESKPLFEFLYRHSSRYELTYRHRWNVHDLVMWDNRCSMHYAVQDYDHDLLRDMQRCCLLGLKTGRLAAAEPAPA